MTAKRAEVLEGADEGVLGDVAGDVVIPGESVGEAIDAVDMRVVERALGCGITPYHPIDEVAFVHPASRLGCRQ